MGGCAPPGSCPGPGPSHRRLPHFPSRVASSLTQVDDDVSGQPGGRGEPRSCQAAVPNQTSHAPVPKSRRGHGTSRELTSIERHYIRYLHAIPILRDMVMLCASITDGQFCWLPAIDSTEDRRAGHRHQAQGTLQAAPGRKTSLKVH